MAEGLKLSWTASPSSEVRNSPLTPRWCHPCEATGNRTRDVLTWNTLRAKTCTFEVPTDQKKTPPKFHEKTSRERKKDTTRHPERERKKERKLWRKREKRSDILGGPGGGSEGGVRRSGGGREGRSGRAPKSWTHLKILITHSTDTPRHTTTHTTTPHNATQQQRNATTTTHYTTRRRSRTGRSWGGGFCREVFWGQVRKGLGTKRFDQKKWCGPKVVRS